LFPAQWPLGRILGTTRRWLISGRFFTYKFVAHPSMAQHTSPNSSRAPGDADEYPAITVVLSECRQAGSNSAVGFTG